MFLLALLCLLMAGCATSEPEQITPDAGPGDPDVEHPDANGDLDTGDIDVDGGGDTDTDEPDGSEPDGGDAGPHADDGGIDVCPGGCGPNEVCTDDGCVDLCAQESYQCGEWQIDGVDVDCGTCPTGVCDEGQCEDYCEEFSAQCGTVYWNGQGSECGACSGADQCRYNQCALPQGYVDLTAGFAHTCGLRPNGEARCWGENGQGQLGNNNMPNGSTSPSIVFGVNSAATLATMNGHSCVSRQDSQVRCWGAGGQGRLGNGETGDVGLPVETTGISAADTVVTGGSHTCAVLNNGRLRCWGNNGQGQLGTGVILSNPTFDHQKSDVILQTGAPLQGVWEASLGSAFSCAVTRDNDAYCWGFNNNGQLGLGDNAAARRFATRVTALPPAYRVTAGSNHACAIVVGGDVYCWGRGSEGQVGDGLTSDRYSPTAVNLPEPAVSIAAGAFHTCAALADGQVYCWGDNGYGQVGQGSTGGHQATPAVVTGVSDVHVVVTGGDHSCALNRSGQVRCWGRNGAGQLGDGSNEHRSSPVLLAP